MSKIEINWLNEKISSFREKRSRKQHLLLINLAACEAISPLSSYWMLIGSAFAGSWQFGETGTLFTLLLYVDFGSFLPHFA